MSENNVNGLPTEIDENLESGGKRDNNSKPPLHSDESSFTENTEVPAEQMRVQENLQSMESAESERPGCLEGDLEVAQPSPSKKQLNTFDASTETKSLERINESDPSVKSATSDASIETESLERINDIGEPVLKSTGLDASSETKSPERASDADRLPAKSTASSEISPPRVPSSDKGLEKVTENIQLIYEGLKDMKISAEEIPVSASDKKGRKLPTTPRARSTPVKPLTSPPLTRSRSRDLRKLPSTPSSPRITASRKTSESGSDEARGRQRAKKY